MAAVERRDPLLIAARAHKTITRAARAAAAGGDEALSLELYGIAGEIRRICGDTAVVRLSQAPTVPRCA